jgi:hypothetical protein
MKFKVNAVFIYLLLSCAYIKCIIFEILVTGGGVALVGNYLA